MLGKFRKLYNPSDPVTYREGFELAGMLWGETWTAQAYNLYLLVMMPLASMHFLMKIVMDHDELDTLKLMEVIHWLIIHTALTLGISSMVLNSKQFLELDKITKSGIYTYPEPLSKEQENILQKENIRIHFYIKSFFMEYLISFVCTNLKEFVLNDEEWPLQFPGWFPFEINSYGLYFIGVMYQAKIGYNIVICIQGVCAFYAAYLSHLYSQLAVLNISIRNLFKEPKNVKIIKKRIKCCVDHHNAIERFSDLLHSYLFIILLVIAGVMVVLLCTVCYVLTDPKSDLDVMIPLFTVFVPELFIAVFFCSAGQRVTDQSHQISKSLYEIKWYLEPTTIKRDLLMIMLKSKKGMKITGGGIQTYNLEGLKDILQASYSYFNMLSALRKS